MDKIISCEFNIDTACVEVKYADGSMISIDCTRVENEVARNMYEASELDWLVYNAPVDYVNLLLHSDIREYLRNTTRLIVNLYPPLTYGQRGGLLGGQNVATDRILIVDNFLV